MRNAIVLMAALLMLSIPALALPNNDGTVWTYPSSGNVLSQDLRSSECNILYCPADGDNAIFRANLAAITGGVVDYFDAREATPSLELMQNYQVVLTYPNNAYSDMVAMGDMLADYADLDYIVILAVWCTYTNGFYLSGRIMTSDYCPVDSPTGDCHFSGSDYADDGTSCIFAGVSSFTLSYRDILVLQGNGIQDGSYVDEEIAAAYNSGVFYANGCPDQANEDWTRMIANMACACTDILPAEAGTWSSIKLLY